MEEERLIRYKKILLGIIEKRVPGCAVYLFGSRAKGKHFQGSDIDLALDAGKIIGFQVMNALRSEIEDTTIPLNVDIVDLHDITGDFKKQVEKEMVSWKN